VAFETIRLEARNGVAWLFLTRPERGNAINGLMSRELPTAWEEIKRDANLSVVVVTGEGDRAFCTGFDVADVASGTATVGAPEDRGTLAALRFTALQNRCWKPVITAVNGMVTGGGLHFLADSDLIIASERATFFDNHVRVGLVSGAEPIGLARRIPLEAVLRMSFLGGAERMNARQAKTVGLVSEVVPHEALNSRVEELAQQILENSPTAMARTKQAIWESLDVGLSDAVELGWKVIEGYRGHPDAAEGASAFAARRKPRWLPLSMP
jgi:enoyl-CoA hydratase/carnithine racemase